MQIKEIYSHLNGWEWIQVHKRHIWEEIVDTVQNIDASEYKTKISKEKTMMNKNLYSPTDLNKAFKDKLEILGWKEQRTSYYVTDNEKLIRDTLFLSQDEQKKVIEAEGKVPIFSYNQTDFEKERVAIEVQFGKYSFIAYDMFVKHLAFYVGDKIDVGVEILPMKNMQKEMSSGPGYYEGALYDLVRQGRGVPSVPLVVIGIEP